MHLSPTSCSPSFIATSTNQVSHASSDTREATTLFKLLLIHTLGNVLSAYPSSQTQTIAQ